MIATCYHGSALPLSACTLCIGFPEKTATDHILEADCVVLGRPSVHDPFSYARGELLKGIGNAGKIDLLVDTRSRRLLASDARRHVVLMHNPQNGGWRSLGIASDDYLSVLARVAAFGSDWEGSLGAERRWRFFLPLFGHNDPSIRELAYLELGRAPYHVIRQLGRVAPRDAYASVLQDPKYLEWRSLAILLLAQSEDPDDQRRVRDSYESAKRLRMTTNLGAWSAALIEIEGSAAVDGIEESYVRSADRSAEEIDAVVSALSMHANTTGGALKERIVECYRALLTHHPRCAPRVAADMAEWGRRDLVEEVAACVDRKHGFDIDEKATIRRYLRGATTAEELALVGE